VSLLDRPADLRAGQMRHHQLAGVAVQLDAPPAYLQPQDVGRPGRRAAPRPVLAFPAPAAFTAPATVTAPATFTGTPALTLAPMPVPTGTAAAPTPLTTGPAPALTSPALATRTPTRTTLPVPALTSPALATRTPTRTARTSALSPTFAAATAAIAPPLAATGCTAPLARRPTPALAGWGALRGAANRAFARPRPGTLATTTAPTAPPGPGATLALGLRGSRCIHRYVGRTRPVGWVGDLGDSVGG
jgi:hypothetical protein